MISFKRKNRDMLTVPTTSFSFSLCTRVLCRACPPSLFLNRCVPLISSPPPPLSLLLSLHSHNGLLIPHSTFPPTPAKCIGHLPTLSPCSEDTSVKKASLYPVRRFRDMLSCTCLSTLCQILILYLKLKCLIDSSTCH